MLQCVGFSGNCTDVNVRHCYFQMKLIMLTCFPAANLFLLSSFLVRTRRRIYSGPTTLCLKETAFFCTFVQFLIVLLHYFTVYLQ